MRVGAMRRVAVWCWAILLVAVSRGFAADGNRLVYLDQNDPFYVSRDFPKLATPQWVGEPDVQAVVILAIDDMRGHQKWEEFLRRILERLKQIDGRAPVSIMTNRIEPREPHLQKWLAEGLSLEVHTYDHPCPLLQKGDLAKARQTVEQSIDLMDAIPQNRAVAFRMPCCDSMNSPSPRFYAEIFNAKTPAGNFLSIDSSVCNIITANDPQLPRELVLDERGSEIFRRYLPFKSFVTTVEDYPYPYVIGRLCWEFPCVVPSDWSAQHVQQPNNPRTVLDWQKALDATVIKQGVFNLIFHPHRWIESGQIIQLIDHAVAKHGKKVKFLTFAAAQQRLDQHLLAGQPLRAADGGDNGVRLLDLNHDGWLDVVIANDAARQTRLWSPEEQKWLVSDFPLSLVTRDRSGAARDCGVRFGVLNSAGLPSLIARDERRSDAWHFDGNRWEFDQALADSLQLDGAPLLTVRDGRDQGVRLRDVDGDGIDELVVSNPAQQAVLGFAASGEWSKLPFSLPDGYRLVDERGRDGGVRFVDIDQDGHEDVLSSNERSFAAHLFVSPDAGWAKQLVAGAAGSTGAIPMIARHGSNNGAWFHGRTLYVQNEDTATLPDLVDRMPLDNLLKDVLFPGPKTPEISRAVTHARPGFQVELAVCEPLVTDPISIAFGPDGKLWVAEMGDYPRGLDGKGKRGGQVRYLEDSDGDGRFDKSTLFLADLGFPTSVAPWRNGVLVTCAPEIFYAEDTDGDGRADRREVLYRGFVQANPQHRVNGLKWGIDGWLYGAHGDAVAGRIKLEKTGDVVNANGRDFRISPDKGLLDPQAGASQYGRTNDDWDNWFGCSNSNPMYQFVLDDGYLRRNPHVPAASGKHEVPEKPGAAEVFPRSRTIARYNDLYAANRFTSANSVIIYRDDVFGPAFAGNAFVSEPVHNLVHREVMRFDGLTFSSRRADDEQESEFLASADNWFRPATLTVGPDGALWVADMYRQTIEHPEWIPQEIQKQVDLRAGSDMGRIYRVYPIGSKLRPMPRLDKLSTLELVAALESPSGWQRDMVQQLLYWRDDKSAIEPLKQLAAGSKMPECRVQALWTLELLGGLDSPQVLRALSDPHAGVRRHAIRLAESRLLQSPELGERILALSADDDLPLQLQRAYTLGAWQDPRAGDALGELALRFADNRYLKAAVLSSVTPGNLERVVVKVLDLPAGQDPPAEILEQLVALATAFNDERTLATALAKISQPRAGQYAPWQQTALAGLLDALAARDASWEKFDAAQHLAAMFSLARATLNDPEAPLADRLRAARLVGRDPQSRTADVASLVALLAPQVPAELQAAAVAALARIDDPQVPAALVAGWKSHGPAVRNQVLDVLVSRDAWIETLLSAVESGQVAAAEIDATRRQRMLRSSNVTIKQRASSLLAGAIESNRAEVLARHADVLTASGDAQAGAAVFAKRCAVCHRLRGAGHEVGPNLAALTDYSPNALLTAILDPNRAVEAKFLDYVAATNSGLTYTGMLAEETGNSITLLGQEGKQQTILRSDLEALQATGKSLMPEGLEKDLTPKDLADVIAFLRGSGAPRKKFPGNDPRLVTPTSDGTLQLYATQCEIYGPTIVMERLYKNLGQWKNENDRAVWNVELPKAGRYAMLLNYAALDKSADNAWVLEAGDKTLTGKVISTGSVDHYQEIRGGEIELPAGSQQIVFRSAGPVNHTLLQLGGILLKPVAK